MINKVFCHFDRGEIFARSSTKIGDIILAISVTNNIATNPTGFKNLSGLNVAELLAKIYPPSNMTILRRKLKFKSYLSIL